MAEKIELKCKHYEKDGEGYAYKLDEEHTLFVCKYCNISLAQELLSQLALETFLPSNKAKEKENE